MLHGDERGDNENLGRLLLLAMVLIPLILLVIFFGQDVFQMAKAQWDSVPDSIDTQGNTSTALVPCRPGMGCFEE